MVEKRILSIDPGGKGGDTGIVLLSYSDDTLPFLVNSWAVGRGLEGFKDWYRDAWYDNATTVIVEQFVHYKAIQIETTPILIEGAVRLIWDDVVLSPASGKDTAVPDWAMDNLGFSRADFGGDHHADRYQACRHAIRWLKNQGHKPTLEVGWP